MPNKKIDSIDIYISEEADEFLKTIKDAYGAGVLDKTIISLGVEKANDKYVTITREDIIKACDNILKEEEIRAKIEREIFEKTSKILKDKKDNDFDDLMTLDKRLRELEMRRKY